MEAGDLAVVVAAVLGGTGLGGVLSGGAQISRRHRLRRSVEKTADVAAKLREGSPEALALESVQRVEAARFAALTLIVLPLETRRYLQSLGVYLAALLLSCLVLVAVLLSVLPARSGEREPAGLPASQVAWLLASAAAPLLFALVCDRWLRHRRELFVDLVLAGASPEDAQVAASVDTPPGWLTALVLAVTARRRRQLIRRRAKRVYA